MSAIYKKVLLVLVLSLAAAPISSISLNEALKECNAHPKKSPISKAGKNKKYVYYQEFYLKINSIFQKCHTAINGVQSNDKKVLEAKKFILTLIKIQNDLLGLKTQIKELGDSNKYIDGLLGDKMKPIEDLKKKLDLAQHRVKAKLNQLGQSDPRMPNKKGAGNFTYKKLEETTSQFVEDWFILQREFKQEIWNFEDLMKTALPNKIQEIVNMSVKEYEQGIQEIYKFYSALEQSFNNMETKGFISSILDKRRLQRIEKVNSDFKKFTENYEYEFFSKKSVTIPKLQEEYEKQQKHYHEKFDKEMKEFYAKKAQIAKNLKTLEAEMKSRNERRGELTKMNLKKERINHILYYERFKNEIEPAIEKENLLWL